MNSQQLLDVNQRQRLARFYSRYPEWIEQTCGIPALSQAELEEISQLRRRPWVQLVVGGTGLYGVIPSTGSGPEGECWPTLPAWIYAEASGSEGGAGGVLGTGWYMDAFSRLMLTGEGRGQLIRVVGGDPLVVGFANDGDGGWDGTGSYAGKLEHDSVDRSFVLQRGSQGKFIYHDFDPALSRHMHGRLKSVLLPDGGRVVVSYSFHHEIGKIQWLNASRQLCSWIYEYTFLEDVHPSIRLSRATRSVDGAEVHRITCSYATGGPFLGLLSGVVEEWQTDGSWILGAKHDLTYLPGRGQKQIPLLATVKASKPEWVSPGALPSTNRMTETYRIRYDQHSEVKDIYYDGLEFPPIFL